MGPTRREEAGPAETEPAAEASSTAAAGAPAGTAAAPTTESSLAAASFSIRKPSKLSEKQGKSKKRKNFSGIG